MREACALLVYDFRASGVVRNALRIAGAAREAGLDISLWPIRLQGELMGEIPAGVPVRAILNGGTRAPRDFDSLRAVPSLARAIDHRRPRVLFSGGNHTHLHAALALLFAKDRESVRFIGRASNAVISGGTSRAPWRRLVGPIERFQFASMDSIVSVSTELGDALADRLGIEGDRLTMIPNGVDLAAAGTAAKAPVAHPFFAAGAPPVILGIGRLSRQKNFESLIRAFAIVLAARPARLLILGSGSDRRKRRLRALAERLGVGNHVDLPGFVPNPATFLSRAAIFALSSRWEGASNVLLEAMACGCPVVATRAPTGIAEVMLNGRLGPLVAVGDDAALARAILTRMAQPRGAAALKARAGAYDLAHTFSAYVDMLRTRRR